MGDYETEKNENETRTVTGACRFCGQIRIIDMTEEEWLDRIQKENKGAETIADDMATLSCNCKQGSDWRADMLIISRCEENIELMFREKLPEIADIFQDAKTLVQKQMLKKITVTTHDGGTATMYKKSGSLCVRYVETHETEMSAEW